MKCIIYTSKLYNYYTLQSVYATLRTIDFTLQGMDYTLQIMDYTLQSLNNTIQSVNYKLKGVDKTLQSMQYTLQSVDYTIQSVPIHFKVTLYISKCRMRWSSCLIRLVANQRVADSIHNGDIHFAFWIFRLFPTAWRSRYKWNQACHSSRGIGV